MIKTTPFEMVFIIRDLMGVKRIFVLILSICIVFCVFGCTANTIPTDPAETSRSSTPPGETETSLQTQPGSETSEPATEPSSEATSEPVPETTTPSPTTLPPETTTPVQTEPTSTQPPAPTAVSIRASVSGSFHVGDTLKREDFRIEITMSDGTLLRDPDGWSASPMKLSGTSNQITVKYGDLKTVITVSATVGAIDGMEIVKNAVQYLGLNYVYGGNSLTNGVDCSGFTTQIYKQYGISLPRTAAAQSAAGTPVSLDEARPGDLYAVAYTDSIYTGHAGIYIGGGYMISAWPEQGVTVTSVSSDTTLLRIFENTCTLSGEEALAALHAHCFSLGKFGNLSQARYYIDSGDAYFTGSSPLYTSEFDYIGLSFYLSDVPFGYEPLVAAWKNEILAGVDFSLHDSTQSYGYMAGVWYTYNQLLSMRNQGLIGNSEMKQATRFYGAFWEDSAVITNGYGEVVDLSTWAAIPPAE